VIRRAAVAAFTSVTALGFSATVSAQELRYDPRIDVPVTLGGAAAFAASEAAIHGADPAPCRWCDRDAAGRDTLNAVDRVARGLRWSRPQLADVISDITGFVATPMIAGGADALAAAHDRRSDGIGTDLLVVAEAGVLAADLNQLAKLLALRERPDIHALTPDARRARPLDAGDDLSFYSGHTTAAVSVAVAAGTVASLRGYRLAPLVWATALPPALVTGYLRIGADRHYFTDVLTGAATGVLIGVLVPRLFHSPSPSSGAAGGGGGQSAATPTAQPYMLGYAAAW
jgi:membrane-associated phospholipid phosphatase